MQTDIPIDEAGRVVIPKSMRKNLGLGKKDMLTAVEENGRIILSPAQPKGQLIKKGNMLVWSTGGKGPSLTIEDVRKAIEDTYLERERRILGLDNEE